ncbi:MAG: polysaccharide lyase family protein [Terracidiphilus sp.]|nr:polysaccharide lyase family protein [Terracidiphilus sp.]
MKLRWLVLFSLVASFSSVAFAAPKVASSTIFQLGQFDRSSRDFSDNDPSGPVKFVVGQSNVAREWFAFHAAAPINAASAENKATAPRTIVFKLERATGAAFKLRVAVILEKPSVPVLRIAVNGKDGLFYLHPKLDYEAGDQMGSFDPIYAVAEVELALSAALLRDGENTIALQPVIASGKGVPDAGLHYDVIELDRVQPSEAAHAVQGTIEPTIFFTRESGELREQVDATVRYGGAAAAGEAVLTLNGKSYRQPLKGASFGEEKISFFVPEFAAATRAVLVVHAGAQHGSFTAAIDPRKQWTLYVVPSAHLDIGYSDYQSKIAAVQSRTIDEALDLMDAHKNFRFSLDGEWILEQFMETRSQTQRQRAIDAIQAHKLFVPAQYANLLTGISSGEALIRSLYPSANFSRAHGSPFDAANLTDVPSYTWSYASILAAAGVDHLAGGTNNYRAPVLLKGKLHEQSPFWWEGPDGARILLWYSRLYQQVEFLFGRPPVLEAGVETLPLFLENYSGKSYRAKSAILYGTQVENTDLAPAQAELAGDWNRRYAFPQLKYAGFREAMDAVRAEAGELPVVRGDGGPYWEDGAGSDAGFTALGRRNEVRALTAEKFTTLTGLVHSNLSPSAVELGRMWKSILLMDEHTWDSDNSISDPLSFEAIEQLAVKDQYAVDAAGQADRLVRRAMANLANAIPVEPGHTIVFNSLNWTRDGLVTIDLHKNSELVDTTTGEAVPVEQIASGENFTRVRFLARAVPAVGYKVYATRTVAKAAGQQASLEGTTLESPFYKVELDAATGAVLSIYDKQLGQELVNRQSPYRFGQYLYVTGGDKLPNTLLHYDRISPKAELAIHAAAGGRVVRMVRTPFGEQAELEATALNTPAVRMRILLPTGEKKIQFEMELDKKEIFAKEGVYFAFPLAMQKPAFRYEIQSGSVDPVRDAIAGAGREWFSVQHWIAAEEKGVSAAILPLDAPLATLGDINRGAWPDEFGARTGTIFSYVMNNYWDTNYRAGQGGRFTFRYAFTSADRTREAELSRLGWEEATALEQNTISPQDKALSPEAAAAAAPAQKRLDGKQQSLLEVNDPAVLVQTWKPAEDGNGTILRLLDLGGAARTVAVQVPLARLAKVVETDAVERDRAAVALDGANSFHVAIRPHQIVTLRLVEAGK